MNITPRSDGRFEVGDRIFQTEAEAKAFAEGAAAAQPTPEPPKPSGPISLDPPKKPGSLPLWGQIVVGLIGAYIVASCIGGGGSKSTSTSRASGPSESNALADCQWALKKISRDPETAEVPYVANQGSGSEFYFAWGISTKPVRMKNGFGALLSTGASCTVNKQTGKITGLTLDGKTVM